MKNLYSFLFLCVCYAIGSSAMAGVITVSNVSNRPAQYTGLQAAVDAAAAGDTILITGGGANYGNVTLVKRLVLIGEGIRSNYVGVDYLYLRRYNAALGSDSSQFIGLGINGIYINGDFSGGSSPLSGYTFERCVLNNQFSSEYGGLVSDITFRHCYFGGGCTVYFRDTFRNTTLTNCIFNGGAISPHVGNGNMMNSQVVIRNSLFLNRTSSFFTQSYIGWPYFYYANLNGLVLENNIFFRAEPTGCDNCVFNNNLTYANTGTSVLPTSGSLGSGNIANADPMFVNFPFNLTSPDAGFSWDHNYELQPGSPAIGTGTNGTNIGIWGGNAPVSQIPSTPRIPAVTELNIPVSSVPVGGTLQINLRAVSRD